MKILFKPNWTEIKEYRDKYCGHLELQYALWEYHKNVNPVFVIYD